MSPKFVSDKVIGPWGQRIVRVRMLEHASQSSDGVGVRGWRDGVMGQDFGSCACAELPLLVA